MSKKRLFIVSNRLPVNVIETGDDVKVNVSSGGLVTAIGGYMKQSGGGGKEYDTVYWAGVPGCTEPVWAKAMSQMQHQEYTFLPVFMNRRTYDNYYNGMSNSVIWPLFHYFSSYAEYRNAWYESYQQANSAFAEALAAQLQPGDVVWVQDYHLLPLSGMLRERIPDLTIGFFLHIPFPSYEMFRIMPKHWQRELLEGILGADLIGFHTIDYASHFLKCLQMVLGLEHDMHVVNYRNRLVKVDIFPISINYSQFNDAYDNPKVKRLREEILESFSGKKMIFSVDRLDYTKGVSSRLAAYEAFLVNNPSFQGKVVFVMVIVPSRDTISRYAERKKLIDEFIGRLNSKLGTFNWQPVIYKYSSLDFDELLAFYTGCDLALITPLRDGMNLVAKEFVASRKDMRGVLVLSEMAGAARELTDAMLINPNDMEEVAEAIHKGLEMPATEQQRRLLTMQERIRRYDVHAWANDFFTQLSRITGRQKEFSVKFLDNTDRKQLLQTYSASKKRLFLLDYDGTLVPFYSLPGQARPDKRILDMLQKLCADPANTVYVISGRDGYTLEQWLGFLPVNLVAEHGARIRSESRQWENIIETDPGWYSDIITVMDEYVRRCNGAFIEKKDFSVAWHYRNAEPRQAKVLSTELYSELSEFASRHGLQVIMGNKVVEVRYHGVDKGTVVRKIMGRADYDYMLCIGDDRTDEDMFRVLAAVPEAWTIKVGLGASFAKYNLPALQFVISLLETMGNLEAGGEERRPGEYEQDIKPLLRIR
jgi:trehalose 6-phosphate synthase/phosphatase